MTRRAASLVFASMLLVPFAFLGVTLSMRPPPASPELTRVFFWIAAGASAFNIALSRLIPPRLGPPRATARDAVAFTRLLVAWALCEAAAIFPLVAHLMTGDARLLGIFGVDVVALFMLLPSDARWESYLPDAAGPSEPRRMVR